MDTAQMIPNASIACMLISGALCVLLPVIALLVVARKYFLQGRAIFFGIGAFLLFALLIEPMVTNLVLGTFSILTESAAGSVIYICIAAALFEETARYASFVLLHKYDRGLGTALNYGIGHGGAQAIFLVGLSMFANATTANMLNGGQLAGMTEGMAQENIAALEQTIQLYLSTPPTQYLAAGVERLAVVPLQIALSVLVYLAASKKSSIWFYPLAILLHAAVKVPAAMYEYAAIEHIWVAVGLTMLLSAGVVAAVVWQYRRTSAV